MLYEVITIDHLLDGPRAIDLRGLVEARVDAYHRGEVDDGIPANAAPAFGGEEHPTYGSLVGHVVPRR